MWMHGLPRAAWGRSGSFASARTGRSGWLLAGLLALVLTSCADPGNAGDNPADDPVTPADSAPAASGVQPSSDPTVVPARAGRQTGTVTPEAPDSITLPSGKVVPVVPVATTRDGTLDVPGDITIAGWWRGGSRIGDPFGSTLLSAHVDSTAQGLGPYAELLSVRSGASVVVTSKHLRQVFTVRSLELIDKGTLSDRPEIFSPSGDRRLTLVTCAGPYVASAGGYQRLAVVTADAVGQPTARAG